MFRRGMADSDPSKSGGVGATNTPSTSSSPEWEIGAIPEAPPVVPETWESASHDALFAATDATVCDACGAAIVAADDGIANGTGYGIAGRGLYVWTRGDEVRVEPAPLCASCASAIGMTALARWEIEEEEG